MTRWMLGLTSAALVSCGGPDPLDDAPAMLDNYAAILAAGYADSVDAATQLRADTQPLVTGAATPDALDAARASWIASRVPYQQTEVGRFYDGPIDDPARGNVESLLNAWPLDEATIDYVRGGDGMPIEGGIINSPVDYPDITTALLTQRNMMPGEENVTSGYHAAEFLLWGQDFDPDGPGDRPFTDFVDAMAPNADRRRTYLDATTQLMVDDLTQVRDAWAENGAYRATFLALEPREALRRVLVGLAALAGPELAGQRINVAYTTKDQNDEHSCFSDTTNADLANDVLGIANVYHGRYTRTDGTTIQGPGLSDLVAARDADLDARLRGQIDQALTDIRAWPTVDSCPSAALQGDCPFDQLIVGTDDAPGRRALHAVFRDLQAISSSLVEVAGLLGISLNVASE